jgi:hypothetical protein
MSHTEPEHSKPVEGRPLVSCDRGRCVSSPEGGFTIPEVVASLTILVLVIGALATVFSGAMRTAGTTNRRDYAVALAIREIEAMHAVPYSQLGFSTADAEAEPSFEGQSTVQANCGSATSGTCPRFALRDNDTSRGTTYSIARHIVWADAAGYSQAYKKTVVEVSWTDEARGHRVRQDSIVYPGGLGTYTGPGASATTTSSPSPTYPPAAPTDLKASLPADALVAQTTVQLIWKAPASSSPPVERWVVQYSTDNFVSSLFEITSSQPVTNTNFDVTSLSPGTTYYFRVLSEAGTGTTAVRSQPSNTASATTGSATSSTCLVGKVTLTPTKVKQQSGGRLSHDLSLAVNTTGSCSSALQARYNRTSTAAEVVYLSSSSGGVWKATLPGNVTWSSGNHTVYVFVGAATTPSAQAAVCVYQSGASSC